MAGDAQGTYLAGRVDDTCGKDEHYGALGSPHVTNHGGACRRYLVTQVDMLQCKTPMPGLQLGPTGMWHGKT